MDFHPLDLQEWTGGVWSKIPSSAISSFQFDTRNGVQHACFLAIPTEKEDGHRYVKAAETLGASAAIVEHEVPDCTLPQLKVENTVSAFQEIARRYRQTLPTRILALTGSAGKTSAKEFLSILLGEHTFKSYGNQNNALGIPLSITHIDGSLHKTAVLEAGVRLPKEGDVFASILQPDVSILINVGPTHLEFFGQIKAVAREKMKLINAAKERAYVPSEWAFLSQKHPTYVFSEKKLPGQSNAILYRTCWEKGQWKCCVSSHEFSIPFPLGDLAAKTFACMIGVALQEGVSCDDIQARLLQWKPLPNRGAWKVVHDRHYFVDCYNANPMAFENSLQQLMREQPHLPPVCYVIGSMLELGKNAAMFHRPLAHCFRIRPEDVFACIGICADALREGFLEQGAQPSQVFTFSTTDEARAWITNLPHRYFYLKGSTAYHLEKLVAE